MGGVAAILAGCAQETLPPPGAPPDCILLCALIRSIFVPPEPASVQPAPKPAKSLATAHPPTKAGPHTATTRRKSHPAPSPGSAAAAEPPQSPASVDENTTVPRSPEVSPDPQAAPPLGYSQLPGSAPIEENTSHFAPMTAEQR